MNTDMKNCCLATGGTPRKLDTGEGFDQLFPYYSGLSILAHGYRKADDFAIIGGGFIGSEIAAALTRTRKKFPVFTWKMGSPPAIFLMIFLSM